MRHNVSQSHKLMGLRDSFDVLSETIERCESRGRPVRSVETTTDPATGDRLQVSMELSVSLSAANGSAGPDGSTTDPGITPDGASLTDEGTLSVEFAAPDLLPAPAREAVGVEDRAVRVVDGELVATVEFAIDPDAGPVRDGGTSAGAETRTAKARESADSGGPDGGDADADEEADGGAGEPKGEAGDDVADRLAAARSEDLAPYEDTAYLRVLYDCCDTFAEMSERIPMDVAAETVRRYMIEAGVHDPTSYDTAADDETAGDGAGDDGDIGDDGSIDGGEESGPERVGADVGSATGSGGAADEQLIADGLGLPEGLGVRDVVDAATASTTVYQAGRRLDLGQGRTRRLFRRLNVLDLLLHRVDRDGEVTRDEVVRRIRQCAAGDPSADA